MGDVFARRLRAAGFDVVGYDIDATKTKRLVEIGGEAAASVAEVAARCGVIIVVVFSTDQVEDVVENAVLPAVGGNSNKILLCASTCDPERLAGLGERVSR